jgi:hypothetical protein
MYVCVRDHDAETIRLCLKVFIDGKGVVVGASNSRLGVLSNSLFEKVGLSLKGNHLHPFKGIGGVVVLIASQRNQKTIGDESVV